MEDKTELQQAATRVHEITKSIEQDKLVLECRQEDVDVKWAALEKAKLSLANKAYELEIKNALLDMEKQFIHEVITRGP